MKKMEKRLNCKSHSHSTYMAFFLSYVLLLLITTSSLFVYYVQIRTSVTEQAQKSKATLLSQLEDNIDQKMKYADSLMNGIVTSDSLQRFVLAYKYGSYSYADLFADIQSTYKPDYLLNYSVYFSNYMQEVVTTGMHMKASEYFAYMYKPVDMDYGTFNKKYLTGYRLRAMGPPLTVRAPGGGESNVLPYIQTFPFSGKPMGQIIILFDTRDISKLISQINESTSSNVYILDGSNNLMFASNHAPELTGKLSGEIQNHQSAFETQVQNQSMIVMSVSSSQNGWKYVLMTPKNIYFHENFQFAMICVVIFAIYLVIGLLLGHFLAKRNSRPIREIGDIIRKYAADGISAESGNEFRTIKKVLLDKFSSDSKLQEIVQMQKPVVTKAYLLSLLKGLEVSYQGAPNHLRSFGIELISENFMTVAMEFDLDSPFFLEEAHFPEENYSLARVIVQNVGCELFENNFQTFFLDLDRDQAVFLLNAKKDLSSEQAAEKMEQGIRTLDEFVRNNFQLSIEWGISLPHAGCKNLPKCYDEAKKALEVSKRNSGGVIRFGDVADANSDYFFPAEIEVQILDLLKNGNYRESRELLENIFRLNSNFSHESRQTPQNFVAEVTSMLTRAMNAVLMEKGKPPVPEQKLRDQIGKKSTLKSVETCCMDFIDSIAREAQNQVVRKTEVVVNEIADFIDKNVEGKPLDLNCLSERFGLTPQYISNIFKRYRKENIKSYISRQKLNRAKELLVTTDLSSPEISMRLGYVNELGIFRLFRKYENMTPGEYRTLYKKSKGSEKPPESGEDRKC